MDKNERLPIMRQTEGLSGNGLREVYCRQTVEERVMCRQRKLIRLGRTIPQPLMTSATHYDLQWCFRGRNPP
ncbi:hypothetical protein GCM10025779_07100 [Arthrobacter cryoconiti]